MGKLGYSHVLSQKLISKNDLLRNLPKKDKTFGAKLTKTFNFFYDTSVSI